MIKRILTSLTILALTCVCYSISIAKDITKQKTNWDKIYIQTLANIKNPQRIDGLGYILSEEEALQKAIKIAIQQKAPVCEALKIAMDMKFNPYEILSGIFNSGTKIDLEKLCLCATETKESSIPKSVMIQAAKDATTNKHIKQDELTQTQCLQKGLVFTLSNNLPDPLDPEPQQTKYSPY